MPTKTALKLCPNLVILPVNFDKYKAESYKIRKIFKDYTDLIEPLSLDEAYLDLTNCERNEGIASRTALEIRKRIFQELRLTASAGIAPNKFLAKVTSDWKKPNGQFTITPNMVSDFMLSLKVERIPGVGKVTTQKMHSLNLMNCADLQKCSLTELSTHFGRWGAKTLRTKSRYR